MNLAQSLCLKEPTLKTLTTSGDKSVPHQTYSSNKAKFTFLIVKDDLYKVSLTNKKFSSLCKATLNFFYFVNKSNMVW